MPSVLPFCLQFPDGAPGLGATMASLLRTGSSNRATMSPPARS